MLESSANPNIQPCESCGTVVDTSEIEPLTTVNCPTCECAMVGRTRFNHFKLLKLLGTGGVGAVYQALDMSLDRMVALKLLRPEHVADPAIVAQFEREASITASINHPHVVRVFSTGVDHDTFYIVMELVDKGSLDDQITQLHRVGEAQVLDIAIQITRGLLAALNAGLIHRDVKPGNILFADARTAKIVDFGLASLAEQGSDHAGEVWGTPYYVAPEKLDSPPEEDFRSDMYSLGSSLFHALTGRAPYDAEDTSIVLLKVLKSRPVNVQSFAPDVSNATAFVIDRMLQKRPEERFQSYEELIEHLQFARDELTRTQRTSFGTKSRESEKSSIWVTVSIVVLVVLAGLLCILPHRTRTAPETGSPKKPAAPGDTAALDQKTAEARKLLQTAEAEPAQRAAEAFHALNSASHVQPLRTWIDYQDGLANLVGGNSAAARAIFQQIAARGLFSTAPGEQKLATFFLESATAAASEQPIAVTAAQHLDPNTTEAMGLLLYGVKNWTLGAFSEAAQLLARFEESNPSEDDAWIADYKKLAERLCADYAIFKVASDALASASSAPEKKKLALEAVRTARGQLRTKSALATQLAAMDAKLTEEVAAANAELSRKIVEWDAADERALTPLRPLIDSQCQQLRLGEARGYLDGLQLSGEKAKPAVALMRRKIGWLGVFKTTLIADIQTYKYNGELFQAGNGAHNSGRWIASEAEASVVTTYGPVRRTWPEVAPPIVIAVAGSFLRLPLPPDQIADRKWHLGIYLLIQGRSAEARALLTDAVAAKPEYQAALDELGVTAAQ